MTTWNPSLALARPSFSLLSLAAFALSACAPDGGVLVRSELPYVEQPLVEAGDVEAVTAGQLAFAEDLLASDAAGEGNALLSPASLSTALTMLSTGARDETLLELEQGLHLSLPQERLHPAMNALGQALASRGQGAGGIFGKPFTLRVSNEMWGQLEHPFEGPFLDVLSQQYDTGVRTLDFVGDPGGARDVINGWVAWATDGAIPDLVPARAIHERTRLVLTNAVYFNAAWRHAFDEGNTREREFRRAGQAPVATPFMHQTERLPYASLEGFEAVELPYDGEELALLLIVPTSDEVALPELRASLVEEAAAALAPAEVAVALPKFRFRARLELRPALESLGVTRMFEPEVADLSGIDGTRELVVEEVVHEAYIDVNEEGTEAAAATGIFTATPMSAVELTEVVFDRPFLFVLRDRETGAPLFVGRVADPSAM